jgi:hypothetical protein
MLLAPFSMEEFRKMYFKWTWMKHRDRTDLTWCYIKEFGTLWWWKFSNKSDIGTRSFLLSSDWN